MPNSEQTAAMFATDASAHAPSLAMPEQFSQELTHDLRHIETIGGWRADGARVLTSGVDYDRAPEDPSSKKSLIG